jgi:hypothetical protein
MTIRLLPGHPFSYTVTKFPGRVWASVMPVPMPKGMLLGLRNQLSPAEWYVYSGLLWFEQVKFEEETPDLKGLWQQIAQEYMSYDAFTIIIESLRNRYVEVNGELTQLVSWAGEDEGLC